MSRMLMDYQDGTRIVIDAQSIDPSALSTLDGYRMALDDAVGLKQFLFQKDSVVPDLFLYKFTTMDGRVWRQDITILSEETRMNFNISDMFLLSEFVHHRGLRLYVIDLTKRIGVTKILIDKP